MTEYTRLQAARILSICASGRGETLSEIAEHVVEQRRRDIVVQTARRALAESIGDGLRWREARAEAEARLRTGRRTR